MDKERQILDQYFDKARSETPVMSRAEARTLLKRSAIAGSVAGTFLGGRAALWSTPLRMAAAASVAVVAGVGIWSATSGNSETQLADAGIPIEQPAEISDAEMFTQDLEALDYQTSLAAPETAREQPAATPAETFASAQTVASDIGAPASEKIAEAQISSERTPASPPVSELPAQEQFTAAEEASESVAHIADSHATDLQPATEDQLPASALAAASPTSISIAEVLPVHGDFGAPIEKPLASGEKVAKAITSAEQEHDLRVFAGYEFGAFWQQLDYLNQPLEDIGLAQLPASAQRFAVFVGFAIDDYSASIMFADGDNMQVNGVPQGVFKALTYDYSQASLNAMYRILHYDQFTLEAGVNVAVSEENIAVNDISVAGSLAAFDPDWAATLAAHGGTANERDIVIHRRLFGMGPRIALAYEFLGFARTGVTVNYLVQLPETFNVAMAGEAYTAEIPDSEQYTNNVWAVSVDMQVDIGSFF